jgi:AraC-like DNA-binding protein
MYDTFENEACFLYMISGEQEINSTIEHWRLNSKEAVLMKCGIHFSEWLKSSKSEKCEAIAIHLHPDVLKKIYEKELPAFINKSKSIKNDFSKNKIVNDELIYNYIASMQFYFNNPSLVSDELLVLKLKELILLLTKTENALSIQHLLDRLFTPREYDFKEIIEAHITSNLTVEELGKLTNTSVSSFKREFKKIFKDSPAQYFKNKKLERAIGLLSLTDNRIGDIAYECGFNDQAHFSRSFLTKFSVTPSKFRMNQKSKSLS